MEGNIRSHHSSSLMALFIGETKPFTCGYQQKDIANRFLWEVRTDVNTKGLQKHTSYIVSSL